MLRMVPLPIASRQGGEACHLDARFLAGAARVAVLRAGAFLAGAFFAAVLRPVLLRAGALPPPSPGFSIERFSAAIRSTTFMPLAGRDSPSSVWMVLPLRLRSIRSSSASI